MASGSTRLLAATLMLAAFADSTPEPRWRNRTTGAFGRSMPKRRYFGGRAGRQMARMLRRQQGRGCKAGDL